jgi:hypothetical protein
MTDPGFVAAGYLVAAGTISAYLLSVRARLRRARRDVAVQEAITSRNEA